MQGAWVSGWNINAYNKWANKNGRGGGQNNIIVLMPNI